MRERLRKILEELEDINAQIQQGGVDPSALDCFKDLQFRDIQQAMDKVDVFLTDAGCNIENAMNMMKEKS